MAVQTKFFLRIGLTLSGGKKPAHNYTLPLFFPKFLMNLLVLCFLSAYSIRKPRRARIPASIEIEILCINKNLSIFTSIRHETYSKLLIAKYNLAIKMTCQVLDKHMTDEYGIDILISSEFYKYRRYKPRK